MGQSILGTRMITQIGIIVQDIEAVSQAYAEFLGVEKPTWSWTDPVEVARTEYMGQPSPGRAKLSFFDCGQLQIELIEPDDQPSTWRDYLNEHGEGPHHIAFVVDGMKEKVMLLEKHGMSLAQKGEYPGGRYAYLDATRDLKLWIELLENNK
ncbi:glyoxalase/bleomycin resistance protein/dioxygenase superfamily protein [Fontibacillus phaseoli]|uniref:Glyoxalase/bleomycin resistance protein/dioxygenase superfamily protein n=1 Tax=Fontibacillus phaseoli TaxID=1416533 RepID=A0A369BGM5_9BACL|nr:VOC family protein [Fontibacillus phaseoli]RCX20693.1 glyoxalase/bleomycin resistance protein/dioxygenase superfamily protein [Fontibacillus phaseoli]